MTQSAKFAPHNFVPIEHSSNNETNFELKSIGQVKKNLCLLTWKIKIYVL